jgi:hypothetical protein
MKKVVVMVTLVALVFSQGCCSIFTSGPQTVSVDSKPDGAKVRIGSYTGVTPYQVSLPRGKDYVIEATYNSKAQTKTLSKSIEPVYWVNILFWPGLIIDLATGNMFKYEPTEYQFDFTQ